jgi:cobyrinic acid a,c-diamide synthase
MMGLHDGADACTDRGSTAEIARLLQAPVVLVLDASALARSAGAVALGFRRFDERVPVVGVIANRVAGEGHAAYLRPAIEGTAGVPLLGWLPAELELTLPERHLGLVSAGEHPDLAERIERWRALVEEHLGLDRLLQLAASAPLLPEAPPTATGNTGRRVRIAVARDEAFQFYYPDNLALLEAAGAELVPFSPLRDLALPDSVGGLYLGGGYPELHASRLAGNETMRGAIRNAAERGLPIYAECGGFMLLCEALVDADGRSHPMVGLVPGRCVMERGLQAIGYREALCAGDNLLGPAGTVIRGHEFHHSRFEGELPVGSAAFRIGERPVGFARGNLLASYVHLHFGSHPGAAEHFVRRCLPPS